MEELARIENLSTMWSGQGDKGTSERTGVTAATPPTKMPFEGAVVVTGRDAQGRGPGLLQ